MVTVALAPEAGLNDGRAALVCGRGLFTVEAGAVTVALAPEAGLNEGRAPLMFTVQGTIAATTPPHGSKCGKFSLF
jgi:hypothetical protein